MPAEPARSLASAPALGPTPGRHVLMLLDQDFPPDLRVENEARTLAAAGYRVTVMAMAPDSRCAEDQLGEVRIVRVRLPAQLRNKMRGLAGMVPLLHLFVWWHVGRIHRKDPVDVLHAHDLYLFGPALFAARSRGLCVVGDMHENWVHALSGYAWSTRFPGSWVAGQKRWQRLEDRWTGRVDHLVVVIDEMKDRLTERGMPADRVTVVPNTVDLEAFRAWPLKTVPHYPGRVLLYTGGMDRHRGLDEAVRALPRVLAKHADAVLVLVGDGATKPELESLVSELGLQRHVIFTGWLAQEEVKSWMAVADIGLIPHRKSVHTDHTIPHKLFHYMLMELPVVASDCAPIERILQRTGAGYVYPSGHANDMAQAVCGLLAEPEKASRMGTAGRKAVEQVYNWEVTSRELVQMYGALPYSG